jgi:hypothetical protein
LDEKKRFEPSARAELAKKNVLTALKGWVGHAAQRRGALLIII